ncbi:MAG: right-handed parallel beta-helix repeat-containing protein [Gammaproteobacteria bacterium]
MRIKHPDSNSLKREIGVFVGPPAVNATLRKSTIVRYRVGPDLEPTSPGSRGILVFKATGSVITRNFFEGSYEDHIHMPTSDSQINNNKVTNAKRLGIVIIQETPDSNSTSSIIADNKVDGSGTDGIQIQGNRNIIINNKVKNSGSAGIKLCGINVTGDCVMPFEQWSEASGNIVNHNELEENAADGK